MTTMLRSIDLEEVLRAAYAAEPGCRVIERGGVHFAVFADHESSSAAAINITELARQIRRHCQ